MELYSLVSPLPSPEVESFLVLLPLAAGASAVGVAGGGGGVLEIVGRWKPNLGIDSSRSYEKWKDPEGDKEQ